MTEKRNREDWRAQARLLGVDPDEPDDARYWSALDRAQGIIDSFKYHQPNAGQIARISTVRQSCIACALTLLQNTPVGADQTVALRKLHEAMMTANKAIVNEVKGIG